MATHFIDSDGRGRIQFAGADRKRRNISLGAIAPEALATIAKHVADILESARLGVEPSAPSRAWLQQAITGPLGAKLVACGLVHADDLPQSKADESAQNQIGHYAKAFTERRSGSVKPQSQFTLLHTVRNLTEFFGDTKPISEVNSAEARDFAQWLQKENGGNLAPATAGRRLKWAQAIFEDAIRRKLIEDNPFRGVKKPPAVNDARKTYVPVATVADLIDAAPDAEWRALIALSRFVGARIPSEGLTLEWSHIDWNQERIQLQSPKTAVHNKATRWTPMFEAKAYLLELAEHAEDGAQFVFPNLRSRTRQIGKDGWGSVNLRTGMLRLIKRAGHQPYAKPWHALRASCETDLVSRFPLHTVAAWMGHDAIVAAKHYMTVTEASWDKARNTVTMCEQLADREVPANRRATGAKPVQSHDHMGTNCTETAPLKAKNPQDKRVFQVRMTLRGFEPLFLD